MIDPEYIPDIRANADLRRAELKHTSACTGCGSREPARIEDGKCSDCSDDWPRCPLCRRWIGEGLSAPVVVTFEGEAVSVCEPCFLRQSPSLPLDYREAV